MPRHHVSSGSTGMTREEKRKSSTPRNGMQMECGVAHPQVLHLLLVERVEYTAAAGTVQLDHTPRQPLALSPRGPYRTAAPT